MSAPLTPAAQAHVESFDEKPTPPDDWPNVYLKILSYQDAIDILASNVNEDVKRRVRVAIDWSLEDVRRDAMRPVRKSKSGAARTPRGRR